MNEAIGWEMVINDKNCKIQRKFVINSQYNFNCRLIKIQYPLLELKLL